MNIQSYKRELIISNHQEDIEIYNNNSNIYNSHSINSSNHNNCIGNNESTLLYFKELNKLPPIFKIKKKQKIDSIINNFYHKEILEKKYLPPLVEMISSTNQNINENDQVNGIVENNEIKQAIQLNKDSKSTNEQTFIYCQWKDCHFYCALLNHLSEHIKYDHVDKQYKNHCLWNECCQITNKESYSSKQRLLYHIKSKHTGEKKYKCDVSGCEFKSISEQYLVVHKKSLHCPKIYTNTKKKRNEDKKKIIIN